MKRLLGMVLCVVMLFGNVMTVGATTDDKSLGGKFLPDSKAIEHYVIAKQEQGYLGLLVSNDSIEGIVDRISGVYVYDIIEGSPASLSGLNNGDLITAINGNTVRNITELREIMQDIKPYDTVTVTITLLNDRGYYKTINYTTTTVEYSITDKQSSVKGYSIV